MLWLDDYIYMCDENIDDILRQVLNLQKNLMVWRAESLIMKVDSISNEMLSSECATVVANK